MSDSFLCGSWLSILVSLCGLATFSAARGELVDLGTADRVPLIYVEKGDFGTGMEFSRVQVGALPNENLPEPSIISIDQNHGRFYSAPDAVHPLLNKLAQKDLILQNPREDSPTLLLVSSPQLDGGKDWEPTAITRSNHHFTLVMTGHDDNVARKQNIMESHAFLLNLGKLDAGGNYTLTVESHDLFRNQTDKDGFYHLKGIRTAELNFMVQTAQEAENRSQDMLLKTPMLADRNFTAVNVPAAQAAVGYQYCVYIIKDYDNNRLMNASRVYQPVYAGTMDLDAWLKTNGKLAEMEPNLLPAADKDPIYVTITPVQPLDENETITVRDVEWGANEATLHVEIWHDTRNALKNTIVAPRAPVVIVALYPPGPGKYEVSVKPAILSRTLEALIYSPGKADEAKQYFPGNLGVGLEIK